MAKSSTRKFRRVKKDIITELPQNIQESILELIAYKFVSVINRILLLHNGKILKFSLSYPDEDCNAEIIHDYVDQWIPFLARKDLEVIDVDTSEQSIFDCPVLEKLTLVLCESIFPNNFRAPKLRCLHQFSLRITKKYSLAGLENLTEYPFALDGDGARVKLTKTCNVVEILSRLPKIEKFCGAMDYMQFLAEGGSPNRLAKPLDYLKTLNISGIYLTELSQVSCLLCVIQSAPNLCTLNISAEYIDEGDLENYSIEGSEDCAIDHLESVTFSNFKGMRAELELVRFLLGRSPLLKTMSIHFGGAMEKDVAATVAEEVFQYFTASSRVQIRYLERRVDFEDFGAFC
ncbi:F-box domain-containing protein [Heracleum sosnowskyi]|uniref:F-box domain-containing protein n=1 Tax=Heracleum sosnowskyi TaxID=360622 RepID=A0AAD8IXW3_9APIA|nr:F-box domain-containing protein [Heracleum sosnowskyi]